MIGVRYAGCDAGTSEPHERSEDAAMRRFATLAKGIAMTALVSLAAGTPALAGTFVYVSNAEDGDIATYGMKPDRRFLYAASRSRPYSVHVYAIDSATGALKPLATSPLAESFPYISLDRTGRFLFGASYAAHLISVNAVGSDGRVAAEPLQVIPVGRNAHSIRIDASNKFVYAPTLGTDQMFQFTFDAKSGHLTANTPATFQMKAMTGPRHFITSRDNKFGTCS